MSNDTPPPATGIANNFVSPQTAVSLPVASGAITMTWKIAGTLSPGLQNEPWLPVLLSAMVGLAFYVVSDPQGSNWREKIPYFLSAFFNTVTLAASVLGLSAAITNGEGTGG